MSALILELPTRSMRTGQKREHGPPVDLLEQTGRLHFWRGASGRSYVHTVFGLIECPLLPAAPYLLVRRDARGLAFPLHIGRLRHAAASLNLAEVRQRGASLGAIEVHAHLLADDPMLALSVELDLKAAHQIGKPVQNVASSSVSA